MATVWGVAWILVCLTIGWVGAVAAAVVAAQHHLDAAADLSSISGAAQLQRGDDACADAARIAADNNAVLSRCSVEDDDVVVTVVSRIALPFGVSGHLSSSARAGP